MLLNTLQHTRQPTAADSRVPDVSRAVGGRNSPLPQAVTGAWACPSGWGCWRSLPFTLGLGCRLDLQQVSWAPQLGPTAGPGFSPSPVDAKLNPATIQLPATLSRSVF